MAEDVTENGTCGEGKKAPTTKRSLLGGKF